jgi:hypothetical protein
VAGAKTQAAPDGSPSVQAKVTVDAKPPVGVTVKVMAPELLPWVVLVDVVDGDMVKLPTGLTILRLVATEVLAR